VDCPPCNAIVSPGWPVIMAKVRELHKVPERRRDPARRSLGGTVHDLLVLDGVTGSDREPEDATVQLGIERGRHTDVEPVQDARRRLHEASCAGREGESRFQPSPDPSAAIIPARNVRRLLRECFIGHLLMPYLRYGPITARGRGLRAGLSYRSVRSRPRLQAVVPSGTQAGWRGKL